MKLIGNILLIPIKLALLIVLIPVIILNLIVAILSGFGSLFINLITGIVGFLFLYQLITRTNSIYDFLSVLLLFLFLGFMNIILVFFPTVISLIANQLGKGLAFWF